jgi:2-polyprenyl-3-methyl-5-hydroxy-6-metoxy-1,4-benzoquinol methylase
MKGIIAGNSYDKYGTKNPIYRFVLNRFLKAFDSLVYQSGARYVHEVGCGEGNLSVRLAKQGYGIYATDLSGRVLCTARKNAKDNGVGIQFESVSIYSLTPVRHTAELVVCCEVLEHLENPIHALKVLGQIAKPYLIVSVPREPIFRIANILRLKYIHRLGNAPGHINHWSKEAMLKLLRTEFEIVKVVDPLPWVIVLCKTRSLHT